MVVTVALDVPAKEVSMERSNVRLCGASFARTNIEHPRRFWYDEESV